MKAEHRKELQTNTLADSIGRVIQSLKTKPTNTSLVVWIFVILAAGLVGAWFWIRTASANSRSHEDLKLAEATTLEDLEKIRKDTPKSPAARLAGFKLARAWMADGMSHLASHDGRDAALENLKKAGDLYADLAKNCGDEKVLAHEALNGAAICCVVRGEVDEAIKHYDEIARLFPESTKWGKDARAMKERLSTDKDSVSRVQTELEKQAQKAPPVRQPLTHPELPPELIPQ